MALEIQPEALDPDLVLEFFWKFSFFECALKREGFLKRGRRDAAEADWDRFGREVKGRFAQVAVPGFQEAVNELKRLSPRRQVVRGDGRLGWDPVVQRDGDSNEEFTLRLRPLQRASPRRR